MRPSTRINCIQRHPWPPGRPGPAGGAGESAPQYRPSRRNPPRPAWWWTWARTRRPSPTTRPPCSGRCRPGGEQSADDLVEATGIPARRVLSALTLLQVRQWVAEAGRRFTTLVELKEDRTHPPQGMRPYRRGQRGRRPLNPANHCAGAGRRLEGEEIGGGSGGESKLRKEREPAQGTTKRKGGGPAGGVRAWGGAGRARPRGRGGWTWRPGEFEPQYQPIKGKEETIAQLKDAADHSKKGLPGHRPGPGRGRPSPGI